MMKSLVAAVFFAALLAVHVSSIPTISSPSVRSLLRVKVTSPNVAVAIAESNSQIWSEGDDMRVGREIDLVASSQTVELFRAMNLTMEVVMPDVDAVIQSQMAEFAARNSDATADDYNKNYHSHEEITERLKFFSTNFENVDFIETIGDSLEGRHVPAVRFGKKPTSTSDTVPTIWIECQIHAREWITAATCMYFTQKLLEGAKTEYKELFDGLQFYVAPLLNPDGFTYSMQKDRLWRKNRRLNKDGSYGVDLNRNWGNHWGEGGASTVPSSDTYRGPKAFSEPESANIPVFLKKIEATGSVIEAALDFHSYSQLILRPYGWVVPSKSAPPNDAEIKKLGDGLRDVIKKVHGKAFSNIAASELYITSGGADDWLGEETKQKKAYTFELRDTGSYGFLLPKEQIIPSGEEILPSVVYFAQDVLKTVLTRKE